ncbi:hypothetical protein [Chitinilyticum piscinae]|uniref:Uncharacterized protein n=1 Tax=Chitinilyticum piscinae TaxID=2866724 RepID=A0A8J7K339_9NEIS|nr:hypothetical protein [Chitinilyticum piscinae]MBE9610852.1 hypothetical protein [Chitinilyticum piscinae]
MNHVNLPMGWARQGEELVLVLLPDRSLAIYKLQAWNKLLKELEANRKSIGKHKYRLMQRSLIGSAEQYTVTEAGVIAIPELLLALLNGRSFAGCVDEGTRLLFR